MRAARYYGRQDILVEDVAEPSPRPGEVKLRVLYAGICGTDLHEYYMGPLLTRTEPHPRTGVSNPVILGHEMCGEIVELGAGVEDLELGQLVAVEPTEACGSCARCAAGKPHLCPTKATLGLTRAGGAFSQYTTVARAMAHVLPDGMTPLQGALVEPMSVGLKAVKRMQVQAGEMAAVHGAGPIGLGAAFALAANGVEAIIVDPSPLRQRTAASLGFRHIIDPTETDPAAAILELTDGLGADASLDAAGVEPALHAAIAGTAYDRTVVIVAVPLEPLVLPVTLFRKGLIHLTATSGPPDFPATIAAMARGDYPLDGWISEIGLDGIVDDGFEPLHRQEQMKVLIDLSTS